jgi:hypothetical protein
VKQIEVDTQNASDVTLVKPLRNFQIYVETIDGRKGIFDVKPYLGRGMWQQLCSEFYFIQVGIVLGAVTWPNGQDIAPQTLCAEMQGCEPEAVSDSRLESAGQTLAAGQTQGEHSV